MQQMQYLDNQQRIADCLLEPIIKEQPIGIAVDRSIDWSMLIEDGHENGDCRRDDSTQVDSVDADGLD